MDDGTRRLLVDAADEIRHLRLINEVLQAKVDTMDLFARALYGTPDRTTHGEALDVVWAIERKLSETADA